MNNDDPTKRARRYWPVPPTVMKSTYEYYNVNKDDKLREAVTKFFLNKDWLKNKKALQTKNAYKIIYTLLRLFVKKHKVNWYELREKNYELVKDFILEKI